LIIPVELVEWDVRQTFVDLDDASNLVAAFFQLDVFVPERMRLEVQADEFGATFE
jgi:hypothetical protein